jgi:hypothetical protein
MDQAENVYLMGFLWADGYVGKKYDIRIETKASDFDYLQPLLERYGFTSFRTRMRYRDGKPFGSMQKEFCVGDVSLNKTLQDIGYREKSIIAPSKILSVIPPNKRYLWWRGFFDGDGCFYCRGASHVFAVWGSIEQDWTELYSLFNMLGIHSWRFVTYRRKGGRHCSSSVSIGKQEDIKKVGDYIYQDHMHIGFTRKYEKYLMCLKPPSPSFDKQISAKPGVHFSVWNGKWICRKTINHRRVVIGSFADYDDACKAYNKYNE